jgi:hypothetical protein
MRRPVVFIAGLLLATGASLALAGPASAAGSHNHPSSAVSGDDWDWVDDSYNNNGNYYCKSGNHNGGLLGIDLSDIDLFDFSC